MASCAISAIGRDRPGIVAAVTEVLLDIGGNIEDSQMSILRGHFAMMLVVTLPREDLYEELRRRLTPIRDRLGLDGLSVQSVDDLGATRLVATHIVSLYGADHPGIVHAAASALAERGISITGLETKLTGDEEAALYVMLIEIAAGDADIDELRAAMTEVGESAGLELSLRELDRTAL